VLQSRCRRNFPDPSFDLEAQGSRFTIRPALAIQVGPDWIDRSGREAEVARRAVSMVFGDDWATDDPDMGEISVFDGVQGRGAANWIPVIEWLGDKAGGGLVGLAVGKAALAGIERIRTKIEEARSGGRRVMVSRGLAVRLAADHVFVTTDETGILQVEFAEEPSSIAGRPVTETSYTGFEPWIVSLVNESRQTRYLLTVDPEGGIQGCLTTPVGEFEAMFSPLPPAK
jgi:hypothetical protein